MMRGKRFYMNLLCASLMIIGVMACSEDFPFGGGYENQLSGESMVSAVKQEGYGESMSRSAYQAGTSYHLVMFTRGFNAAEMSKSALSSDSVLRYNGLATETSLGNGEFQYLKVNNTSHDNNDWFSFKPIVDGEVGRRSISLYGFTYGEEDAPELDRDGYKRTEEVVDGNLKDLMWGILVDQNDATAKFPCEIPFRHAFSRLEFKVSQLESEDGNGEGMYKLGIENITVTGTYKAGTVDLFTGKTTLNTDNKYEDGGRTLSDMAVNYGDGSYIGVKPVSLGEMIVFPSAEESIEGVEAYKIGLKITLKGSQEEVEKLVGSGKAIPKDDYYIGVYVVDMIYSSVYGGNDLLSDGSVAASPLYMQAGSRYVLQIVLMADKVRVVTVVPSKVEWLPGEIDQEDNPFSTEVVGQPVFFDNTMWMDRNLGANAANPETDYNRTIGYYYQNNRNIPYWPYKLSTFNSLATERPTPNNRYIDELTFSAWNNPIFKVYPVIDKSIMEKDPRRAYWRTGDDDDVKKITTLQKEIDESGTYIFFSGSANVPWTDNSWEKRENQPAPPGWALPTKEQFQSIFPTTVFAGNITFKQLFFNEDKDWDGKTAMDLTTSKLRICVPFYKDGDNNSQNSTYFEHWKSLKDPGQIPGSSVYRQGHSPYDYYLKRWEPNGDPYPGYCSVYIISREENDVGTIENEYYNTRSWGTVYGIKKVGTTEAYRMRWKVKNADMSNTNPLLYIEVSMYTCTKYDNLTCDNISKYDWEHPVSEMFVPLCGQVEGRNTNEGIAAGFSSYGTAVLYATSTGDAALHIKITGDNPQNQYMSVVNNEIQTNAKQIRLVKTQN